MKRFICIHGHFYQPPRENPWLEAVETQDSAHPYHDWNERITAECYAPNASARILDDHDRITGIVDNYATISFNFGPTLLSWLEAKAPDTYASILEADRASQARFSGHGSAIAQAYNHMILPLANARDKQTQVRWGIRDFETRFGRKPEGMWLPETAVDVDSLEALAAEGILFTILEPQQAARHRPLVMSTTQREAAWIEGTGIDPTNAYLCKLPSGRSISILFYDGPISRGVAFENLLDRGEHLAHRLLGAFNEVRTHAQLVHIATDGETYGHHHPYGDMALAYALYYIDHNDLARITNYGEFLELHPPTDEVEIVERTAWSCSHGIERWRSDCGCSGGGGAFWNQRWRTPLREALDWLRDEAATIFEREGAKYLRDPWQARDAYIDVVLDRSPSSLDRFVAEHALGIELTPMLELLEMQRNAMLMYTSCGWFFSDISGIETVQVLHYAGRVIQLAERRSGKSLEPAFLDKIELAQSNVPEHGDARKIYERDVLATRLELSRVAAHYAVSSLFDDFDAEADVYCYRVVQSDFETYRSGRARMAIGSVEVRSLITHERQSFDFAVLHLGETELTGGVRAAASSDDYAALKRQLAEAFEPGGIPAVIRILDQRLGENAISIRSLFRDEQRRILNVLCDATLQEAETAFRQLHERYDPLMRFHTRLAIPLPKVLQMAAEFDLNLQLRRLLERDELQLDEIAARLREATEERVIIDETTKMVLKAAVERMAERFDRDPEDLRQLEAYATLVSLVRASQPDVPLRKAQNLYYRMRGKLRPLAEANAAAQFTAHADSGNGNGNGTNGLPAAQRWLDSFDALGRKLSISTEVIA